MEMIPVHIIFLVFRKYFNLIFILFQGEVGEPGLPGQKGEPGEGTGGGGRVSNHLKINLQIMSFPGLIPNS